MCGIAAVLNAQGEPAAAAIYEALLALQHRGQDAAGIVTEDQGRLCLRKDNGMVRDVFSPEQMFSLTGDMGIGHVRYPTAGSSSCAEAQPFYVNSPYGISLAHNGNLVNTAQLQEELLHEWRHVNTGSDSEVLLNILASALLRSLTLRQAAHKSTSPSTPGTPPEGAEGEPPAAPPPFAFGPDEDDLVHAVEDVMRRCTGGFAVVTLVNGYGLVGFRDQYGIRPLVYGRREAVAAEGSAENGSDELDGASGEQQWDYMLASESGALQAQGFEILGDVPPGHALLAPRGGSGLRLVNCLGVASPPPHRPCVFEYVYFARPDSVLDGISVYRTRLRMGEKLAHKLTREWAAAGIPIDIDAVIPVPDTARTAALECATALGIKYREGFIKNRYVGRTFIMPQQKLRSKSVRQKLSPIHSEFAGRNVLLVDDSIVRGTTSSQIVQMARDAGAKAVYFASAAPPVKFPNVYGIDMPTATELIAASLSMDEIAKSIGADRILYQDLDDLRAAILEEAASTPGCGLSGLDCSCFDGEYVTSNIGQEYLAKLASSRNANRGASVAAHSLDKLDITENGPRRNSRTSPTTVGAPAERSPPSTSPPRSLEL